MKDPPSFLCIKEREEKKKYEKLNTNKEDERCIYELSAAPTTRPDDAMSFVVSQDGRSMCEEKEKKNVSHAQTIMEHGHDTQIMCTLYKFYRKKTISFLAKIGHSFGC